MDCVIPFDQPIASCVRANIRHAEEQVIVGVVFGRIQFRQQAFSAVRLFVAFAARSEPYLLVSKFFDERYSVICIHNALLPAAESNLLILAATNRSKSLCDRVRSSIIELALSLAWPCLSSVPR